MRGTGPKGVTDKSETLLDGKSTGQPGSDYVTTISRSEFVFTTYSANEETAKPLPRFAGEPCPAARAARSPRPKGITSEVNLNVRAGGTVGGFEVMRS